MKLLFSSGIVDSFAPITLMTFLESQCGFRIGPMEVTLENFDSVDCILQFAERKQQEMGQGPDWWPSVPMCAKRSRA